MSPVLTDRDPGDEDTPRVLDLAVVSWRYEVLIRAGYPSGAAVRIAESGVDLHDAVELLSRGCPVTRAVEILL